MKKTLLFLWLFTATLHAQKFDWISSGHYNNLSSPIQPVIAMVIDSQGNLYKLSSSTGIQTSQEMTIAPYPGETLYLYKYNPAGEIVFIKRAGNNFLPLNIVVDDQDNVYVLGNLYGNATLVYEDQTLPGGQDYRNFLLKINPEGELQWHVKTQLSGSYGQTPLLLYSNNHLFLQSGHTSISKLNTDGEVMATLTPDAFVNYNAQDQFFLTDAEALPNGDLLFYGCAYATITYEDTVLTPVAFSGNVPNVLLKTNADLEFTWAKMYNGLNTSGAKMSADDQGNIYLGVRVNQSFTAGSDTVNNQGPGTTNYTDAILKVSTMGEPLWIKPIADAAHIISLVNNPDGSGILFGGYMDQGVSFGSFNMDYANGRAYIAKINYEGEITNAFNVGRGSYTQLGIIQTDTDGNLYAAGLLNGSAAGRFGCLQAGPVIGFFLGRFTEDPVNAPMPVITQNGNTLTASPAFEGTIQWYFNDEPISEANGQTLEIGQPGSYTVSYELEFSCAPSVSQVFLSAEDFHQGQVSIYPNPSSGKFILKVSDALQLDYTVVDYNGRRIATGKTSGERTDIDLSSVSSGVYLLHLTSDRSHKTIKLINTN